MKSLDLMPDVYGDYARHSAIADHLELVARRGKPATMIGLETTLYDLDLVVTDKIKAVHMRTSAKKDTAQEKARKTAERVFQLFVERQRVLAKRYPYRTDGKRLEYESKNDTRRTYSAMLALSLAHAHRLKWPTKKPVPQVFEATLHEVADHQKVRIASIYPPLKTKAGTFEERLERAAKRLPGPARDFIYHKQAKDEDVDVVVHCLFRDNRPGNVVMAMQATVGTSDTWEKKSKEVMGGLYRKMFQLRLDPVFFLAIPHHVEPLHLELLHQRVDRVHIMDRLRIARLSGVVPSCASDAVALLGKMRSTVEAEVTK
jgi:hypothetical protein